MWANSNGINLFLRAKTKEKETRQIIIDRRVMECP
jgi:hypothetical protein